MKTTINIFLTSYFDHKHDKKNHPNTSVIFVASDAQIQESIDLELPSPEGIFVIYRMNKESQGFTNHQICLYNIHEFFQCEEVINLVKNVPNPMNWLFQTNISSINAVLSNHIGPALRLSLTDKNMRLTPDQFIEQVLDKGRYLDKWIADRDLVKQVIQAGVELLREGKFKHRVASALYKNKNNRVLKTLQYQCRKDTLLMIGITDFRNRPPCTNEVKCAVPALKQSDNDTIKTT